MKQMVWLAIFILVVGIGAGGVMGSVKADDKVNVVVTINVLQDMVEQIGGEHVSVKSLVTGLENPHTYSTTPDDRKAIENSDLFVEIGMGLEPWASDLTVDLPKDKILVASENCTKLGDNPHVWMDPENGKTIAKEIENRLEKIDPTNSDYYRENLKSYVERLNSTESRIISMGESLKGKGVISATPAFSYLLNRMGINVTDIIVKGPGKEPSTSDIMRMEDEIKSGKASIILTAYQINMPVVDQISKDTGAPVVVGTALLGVMGIDSYEGMLLYDADAISSGLETADMQIKMNSMDSQISALQGEITLMFIGLLAVLILAIAEGYEIMKLRRGDW
jgi:ABC-type Zn uptake system ZnuABC Zn-binding protein ZnuA